MCPAGSFAWQLNPFLATDFTVHASPSGRDSGLGHCSVNLLAPWLNPTTLLLLLFLAMELGTVSLQQDQLPTVPPVTILPVLAYGTMAGDPPSPSVNTEPSPSPSSKEGPCDQCWPMKCEHGCLKPSPVPPHLSFLGDRP